MVGRRLGLSAAVLAGALAVAGCNASALTKREVVVHFYDNASQAEHHAALKACGHVSPDASPEPFTTSGPVSNQVGDVRFRVDHADDKTLSELYTCLAKQPGVQGVDIPDLTD